MNKIRDRWIQKRLFDILSVMPVVAVTGARQTGKTTLVRELLQPSERTYYSFDDFTILDTAANNPGLLLEKLPITIDEVQREPKFLFSIKSLVDAHREPGSILLTGSSNFALLSSVSETLAGRAFYLELFPFCPLEWTGSFHIDQLMDMLFADSSNIKNWPIANGDWKLWLLAGGMPPCLQLENQQSRAIWLGGYIQTYLERDLRSLSHVTNLVDFQRLMRILALRTGRLLNQSEIARDAALPQPTTHRFVNLLETGYQIIRLPVYSTNPTTSIVKSKKLFFADSGVAAYLAGIDNVDKLQNRSDIGFWFEQSFFQTLLVWKSLDPVKRNLYFWRDRKGNEVDFICEMDGKCIAIELKSGSSVCDDDFRGLRAFKDAVGKRGHIVRSIIFHNGTTALSNNDEAILPAGCFYPVSF